jgi:hypothetical protein
MGCSKDKAYNLTDMEAMIELIVAEHTEIKLIVFGETILPTLPCTVGWSFETG